MKLNGKEYELPKLNSFKDIMAMENKGVNVIGLVNGSFFNENKPLVTIVTAFAFMTGLSLEDAADEIEKEVISGTTLDDLTDRFLKEVQRIQSEAEKSGFLSSKKPQDHKTKATRKTTTKTVKVEK